jgi:peptidyl-prolyl cis-trans isomerase D
MITWFQTFFLKHNKWLFSALLVVVIFAFVLTIGNQSFGSGHNVRDAESIEYYGYDLNSPADMRRVQEYATISAQLHPEDRINRQSIPQYSVMRLAALGLAGDLGVAAPTQEQLQKYIESLSVFQQEDGSFNTEIYNQFRQFASMQAEGGEKTLAKVLIEDYRIAKVRELLGGPGYVLPFGVEEQIRQRDTAWEIVLAQRSYEAFQPEIEVEADALKTFYENNPSRYEVPEQIRVSAVRFTSDRFTGAVSEPTEADLQAYFDRNSFRYQPRPQEGEEEPAPVTLADVRDQVVADWTRQQAKELAQTASDAFVTKLYEGEITRDSEAFGTALDESKGLLSPLDPYARGAAPSASGIPNQLFGSMWIYTTGDRYYSDPTATANGAAVLIFEEKLPSRLPPFEEVAAQVEADWKAEERRRLFVASAEEWETKIDEALAAGTSFSDAAAELGFEVSTPERFDGTSAPNEIYQLQLTTEFVGIEQGEVSPVVLTGNAAAIFKVEAKEVPTIDPTAESFQDFLSEQIDSSARATALQALSAWTDRTIRLAAPEEESAEGDA